MKTVWIALLTLGLVACGGGSSPAPAPTTPPPNPGPPPVNLEALTKTNLENCFKPFFDEFMTMLDIAKPFWNPAGVTDPDLIAVSVQDQSTGGPFAEINIALTRNGQEILSPDACFEFYENGGQQSPFFPFPPPFQVLGNLGSDISLLPGIMGGGVPDGTVLLFVGKHTGVDPSIKAEIGAIWNGGVAQTVGTFTTVDLPDCELELQFDPTVPVGNFDTAIPEVVINVDLKTPDGHWLGTITLDRTNVATINVTRDGTDTFDFELDLTTGIATAL